MLYVIGKIKTNNIESLLALFNDNVTKGQYDFLFHMICA